MRYLIIRYNWFNKNILTIVFNVFVICILTGIFTELITRLFNQAFLYDKGVSISLSKRILNSLGYGIVFLSWNGIYFTYLFFQKIKNQEVQTINLKASKNEMQLKNLRNQLNPHFLFNALNSIKALVDLDPKTAKTSITELSSLLRKSLTLGEQNLIHINQELEIVRHYLELEHLRFEERLAYTITIENEDLLTEDIPPFLVQNLVENAIKHGISNKIEGGKVDIIFSRLNGKVNIKIANSGKLVQNEDAGIGIQNTIQRLQLLFEEASFTLKQEGEMVVAEIKY